MSPRRLILGIAALLVSAGCGAAAQPQPGTRFVAILPVPVDQASRAVLTFDISDDGRLIEYLLLDLTDLECATVGAERSNFLQLVNAPIEAGRFTVESSGVGVLSGQFVSPTHARGDVTLHIDTLGALTNFIIHDPDASCDLGTYQWEAEAAGEAPPTPTAPSLPYEVVP
ncbi:MAG: hypothetical protein A2146_09340 [Actinobacteria bacterium RBG_16_67_10]|nr:MAG: hypothetical protein A2146_09340 [Actinobacteria bacterium RBG_16_67_10]